MQLEIVVVVDEVSAILAPQFLLSFSFIMLIFDAALLRKMGLFTNVQLHCSQHSLFLLVFSLVDSQSSACIGSLAIFSNDLKFTAGEA